jgi:hypothetical protein
LFNPAYFITHCVININMKNIPDAAKIYKDRLKASMQRLTLKGKYGNITPPATQGGLVTPVNVPNKLAR